MSEERLRRVRDRVRPFPDFPEPGVLFRDISPLLKDPVAFRTLIDLLEDHVRASFPKIDFIAGEGEGNGLLGPSSSTGWEQECGLCFLPSEGLEEQIAFRGPLIGRIKQGRAALCSLQAELEIQSDAVEPGQKVVIVDDLLATGGTMCAACELLKRLKAEILECLVVIELKALKGSEKLNSIPFYSLLQYD
ncbi:APT phosphoribosyltransferase, partial [Leiothrix lutea]|nr:APT phosphoribosyltransferase [Leiothrix lutea]